ncbi:MAG: hypothetical protein D3921_08965 [Candidatus Electrothrix sp. AW1]|nr:hypothetical protein [Candidatus Electrothrix sp. AX1]MCI5182632.1 hypothetical protein [Candidatus Electrothrix gigas]
MRCVLIPGIGSLKIPMDILDRIMRYIITSFLLVVFTLSLGSDCSAISAIGNPFSNPFGKNIAWQGYRTGLAQAKREGRPAIIIFYSETCSACRQYQEVLRDSRVVEASAPFVMIRVNIHQQPRLNAKYQLDGWYVPRTFAVFPNGRIMFRLYPPKKYRYFIGLRPEDLLTFMQQALAEMYHQQTMSSPFGFPR